MVLLGLSIFIASVSFICYRHPPLSWPLWQWFQGQPLQNVWKTQGDAPVTITSHDETIESREIPLIRQHEDEKPTKENPPTMQGEFDRKAMPPPPRFKKPPPTPASSSPTTLRTQIPSCTLSDSEPPSAPSFPALNSAQRASSGARAPPCLPPPGLMAPPPKTSPLPSRGPSNQNKTTSSSLALPPTHTTIPTKPRKKVLLSPGHSPLDWARLTSSPNTNLRGKDFPPNAPYLRVPPSLLRQFTGRKGKDAWTVLGGKVYNITPYMPYHPGGEPELMKAAGRDGTKLFGEVHPWVNWEGMLEGCLVGIAVEEGDVRGGGLEEMD